MKAVVVHDGAGDVRYEEYEEPQVSDGKVKIRVMACGICGSDIPRVWKDSAHNYPIILGHEFSGYVVEVGADVKNIEVGDHVTAIPLVPCLKCPDCQKGNYSLCKHYSFIGSRQQGAMADFIVVPELNVFKIDKNIPYEVGAMFETCTVAMHGIRLSNFNGGGTALVLGGGTVGCFTLQWLKILGAEKIVVVGRSKEHLKVAENLGADAVVSTLDADHEERLLALTNGAGYDYVYETAGSTEMMRFAFKMAANKANVCMIGTPTSDLTFDPKLWENLNRKEFNLTGSWMYCSAPFPGEDWRMTQHFFANGKMKVSDDMIFQKFKMEDAKQAFDLFQEAGKVKGRVLLVNED